jgi:mannose-6-phosphate isomerase-like protein (cupin superfamily)
MRSFLPLLTGTLLLTLLGSALQAETLSIYRDGLDAREMDQILKENPLAADQPLRSTLVHQTEHSSIHLVQIRTTEKPHIHRIHDLFVVLQRGSGILHIGRETIPMGKGDSVLIPRGVVHFFENTGREVAVGLGIFTPPYDGKDNIPVESPSP